jgi:hypothetical protein
MLRHNSRGYIHVTCNSPSGAYGCMIENKNPLFKIIEDSPGSFVISNDLTINDFKNISACKLFFDTGAYDREITKIQQILNTRSFTLGELNLKSIKGDLFTCTIKSNGLPFKIKDNITEYLHLIFINKCCTIYKKTT